MGRDALFRFDSGSWCALRLDYFCIFPCPSAKVDDGGFRVDDFGLGVFAYTFLVGLLREFACWELVG